MLEIEKMKKKIIKYRDIKLPSNYQEIQFNNWKESVKNYKFWERAAQINEYVADLLYSRNRKNFEKLLKLQRTAQTYLAAKKYPPTQEWQIDIIGITLDRDREVAKIKHFKNVEV